ncbi:putative bifunctional diguanylate cyclase/phosphodiesterase [Prosthecomicrobium sp. N25]|uniref:putative bifunctional diguanylate cyclase/phosphodiesterase n=1 Tax=Prosthecomicrobium sp. N25 TaxID=3129254 RepID=UPI0030785705
MQLGRLPGLSRGPREASDAAAAEEPAPARPAVAPRVRASGAGALVRSYQFKFVLAVVPALFLLNLAANLLLEWYSTAEAERDLGARQRLVLHREARAAADALQSGSFDRLAGVAERIARAPDVVGVRIVGPGGDAVTSLGPVSAPDLVRREIVLDAGRPGDRTVFGGVLEGYFRRGEADQMIATAAVQAFARTLIASLALVGIVILTNRRLVNEPLRRVTQAIRASQIDGSRQAVDWESDDEFGELAASFNEMQSRLQDAEQRRRSFNERLARLYNRTPAMLHCVDREGFLIHVSDHWLVATGYSRQEVIGRKLSEFLTPDSAAAYLNEILPAFSTRGETPETPLRLRRWDGTVLDVVLSETVDQWIGGKYPLSLSVMSDISRMKAAERELVRLALTDPVTGLANRRGFSEAVDQAAAQLGRGSGRALAVFIDLDRFKRINDTYGHAAGDRLLTTIAGRLAEAAGERAIVGRLGGDEFAVFVPCSAADAASAAPAERLLDVMRRPIDLGAAVVEASGSVGVARFPEDGTTGSDLLMAADLAVYRAKQSGRNRIEVFDRKLAEARTERHRQEQDVRAGLAHGWFEAHLQPIVRLSDGGITGGELLLRLRHPEKGLIYPGQFIAAAEECGLIEELGRFVLETAARIGPDLIALSGDEGFYLSVNLSGAQVTPDLPDLIRSLLARHGLKPQNLVLEIMETALLDDADAVDRILTEIAGLGVRFALDDFGTGYSSLNYVDRFPVSVIKIDRSFTRALGEDGEAERRTQALVRTTITLGAELGLPIVAEGIERNEEMERMVELGVEYGQGYLFAPPMPHREFRQLLAASARTSQHRGDEETRLIA